MVEGASESSIIVGADSRSPAAARAALRDAAAGAMDVSRIACRMYSSSMMLGGSPAWHNAPAHSMSSFSQVDFVFM